MAIPIDVTVTRSPGDRPGGDIVEAVLADRQAARERGRAEIEAGTAARRVEVECRYQPTLRPGQTLRIADGWQGLTYSGKVTSVRHSVGSGVAVTRLSLWVPEP